MRWMRLVAALALTAGALRAQFVPVPLPIPVAKNPERLPLPVPVPVAPAPAAPPASKKVIRLENIAVMGKMAPEKKVAHFTVRGTVRAVLAVDHGVENRQEDLRMLFELEVTDPMEAAGRVNAGDLLYLRGWAQGPEKPFDPVLSLVPKVDQEVLAHFDQTERGACELIAPNGFSTWSRDVSPGASASASSASTSSIPLTSAGVTIPATGAMVLGEVRFVYRPRPLPREKSPAKLWVVELTVTDPLGTKGLAADRTLYLREWSGGRAPEDFEAVSVKLIRARDGGLDLPPDGITRRRP